MIPLIYSLWTVPNRNFEQAHDFLKISKHFSKKFFSKTVLFTDDKGWSYVKDLKFDEVYLDLNNLSREYHKIWSMGKIYSYGLAAKKFGHYIHLDYDAIITKQLPENFMQADIVGQQPECFDIWPAYDSFRNYLKYPSSDTYKCAPNMGIFGGKDSEFSIKLFEEAKSFYVKYRQFLDDNQIKSVAPAIAVEQWLAGAIAHHEGKKFTYLFNDVYPSQEDASKLGFIHLWTHKNHPAVKIKTAELLSGIKQ